MKAVGCQNPLKADVGKLFAHKILTNTSSRLVRVMCLFFVLLLLSCNPEKNQPVTSEEKPFVKIDFAWAQGNGFFGGLIIESSGHCIKYHKTGDSSFAAPTQLPDSIIQQINEIANRVQNNFSCLDHINSDTSTVKLSEAPLAEIRIFKSEKVNIIRCYILPGENPHRPDSAINTSISVLNNFFDLYVRINHKLTTTVASPSSEALKDILSLRPPPPLLQQIKFDEK